MTLNEYQEQAMTTCMESSNNFAYMTFNLQGEVGEFCSKIAKAIRKEKIIIDESDIRHTPVVGGFTKEEFKNLTKDDCYGIVAKAMDEISALDTELKKECGDILWQLAGLASVMGWKLQDIADMNLEKLAARKEAGTIDGNGDGICGKDRV